MKNTIRSTLALILALLLSLCLFACKNEPAETPYTDGSNAATDGGAIWGYGSSTYTFTQDTIIRHQRTGQNNLFIISN